MIVILLLLLSFVYQDRAKKEIAYYASRYAGAEITFDKVKVSLLRNFPRMRVEVYGVAIHDGTKEPVKIKRFTILFKAGGIFSNILDIEKVVIADATVSLVTDENGIPTRIFTLQDSTSSGSGKNLLLNSQEISIKNLFIRSENKIKNNLTRISVERANFSLDINGPITRIDGEVAGTLDSLISRGTTIFSSLPVKLNGFDYVMDAKSGEQHLEKGEIIAAGLKMIPSLALSELKDGYRINLSIRCTDELNAFLSILRMKLGGNLAQRNKEAKAYLDFKQQGLVTASENPYTELEFRISNADVDYDRLPYPVSGLLLQGNYNNGPGRCRKTAIIKIDTLHAAVGESYIMGSLLVENLQHPYVKARLTSKMELSDLVKPSGKLSASGMIKANAEIRGHLSDFTGDNITGDEINFGEIGITGLNLFLDDSMFHIKADSAMISVKDKLLDIRPFSGTLNDEPFTLEGTVSGMDRLFIKKDDEPVLKADLRFSAGKINLDDQVLNKISTEPGHSTGFSFMPGIELNAAVSLDTLLTEQLTVSHLTGNVSVNPGMISVSFPDANLLGSSASINLDFKNVEENSQMLTGNISLDFDTLDFQSFLYSIPVSTSSSEENITQIQENFKTILDISLNAHHAKFERILTDSISIIGHINGKVTEVHKFTFNYGGGQVSLEGIFKQDERNTVAAYVMTGAKDIDIDQLLEAFGNFGQSYLTDQSITGKVSWTGDLFFRLDTNLNPLPQENFWKFDLLIDDALLSGVEPIEKSFSFIRQKSKENILVNNMDFTSYYVNNQLYIENVMVKNSIADMMISGIYAPTLKKLDLDIQLSLSDLLFKSTKKKIIETEDGEMDLGKDRKLSLIYANTAGQRQLKVATKKEHMRNLAESQKISEKFDRELQALKTGLLPGKPD